MNYTALNIDLSDAHRVSPWDLDLFSMSKGELATHIADVFKPLPTQVLRSLKQPFSSSVPLIVLSRSQDAQAHSFADSLALYSRQSCGVADSYQAMLNDVALQQLLVYNGGQLADWFDYAIDTYYVRAVSKRFSSDGVQNVNYDASHVVQVPIAEFVSRSLESSYARLVCAVADRDDGGAGHVEVDRLACATDDALAPAGVQLIHLQADGAVATCFVTFKDLIRDVRSMVMF